MKSTFYSHLFAGAIVLAALQSAQGQTIPVVSYAYGSSPSSSYPDTGGVEMTDGITYSVAWGAGPISFADVTNLSGWQGYDPDITFTFDGPVTIGAFTVWAADSEGAAGVSLPHTITLSDPSVGFSMTFPVINPVGAGTTVPLSFGGFSVTTSQLRLTAPNPGNWVMFSEVSFASAIPEPAGVSALAGLFAAGCVGLRRRRRA